MGTGQTARKLAFAECLGCPCSQGTPCKAENLVDKVLFVQAAHVFLCYQRTSFGDSFICRCPVRKEIYERYGQ
jgi:hypothetical protein